MKKKQITVLFKNNDLFMSYFKAIIPSPEALKGGNNRKICRIQSKLNDLFFPWEGDYSSLKKKNKTRKEVISNLFIDELSLFQHQIKKLLSEGSKASLTYKLLSVGNLILRTLLDLKLEGVAVNNISCIKKAFLKILDIDLIFENVTIIICRSASNSMVEINVKSKSCFNPSNLITFRSYFLRELYEWLEAYILCNVVELIQLNSELSFAQKQAVKKNLINAWANKPKTGFSVALISSAHILLSMFEREGCLLYNKVTIHGSKRSQIKYQLPPKVAELSLFLLHLPQFVKPKKLTKANFLERGMLKHLRQGQNSLELSEDCINSLSITQEKSFVIDPIFLSLVKELIFAKPKSENALIHKFPNIHVLSKLRTERLVCLNLIESKGDQTDDPLLEELKALELKISKLESELRLSSFLVNLAENFLGFKFYFDNFLDYRGRMYPKSYLFSRTSGKYKYFSISSQKTRLTIMGTFNFFSSYYSLAKPKHNNFLNFWNGTILKIKNNFLKQLKLLKDYFLSSRHSTAEINTSGNSLYFKLYDAHIINFFDCDGFSQFAIEFDQKSSSTVFLSLILRQKRFALYSNLINSKAYDIRYLLMSRLDLWFEDNSPETALLKYNILNNKKFLKYLLMCWCYGQSSFGRIKLFKKLLNIPLYPALYSKIYILSHQFTHFLDEVFPGLNTLLGTLNSAALMQIKANASLSLQTLSGTILKWSFFSKEHNTLKFKNPFTLRHESVYSTYVLKEGQRLNTNKILISFVPAFIHSLDSDLLRMVIRLVFNRTGYRINHLHDSISVHPNHTDVLFSVLKDIYQDPRQLSLLKHCFFNVNSKCLSKDNKKKFLQYYKDMQRSFSLHSLNKFTPKNCYSPEGGFIPSNIKKD